MIELLVVGFCLLFNAIFAACEAAFISVPRAELRRIAKAGGKEGKILLKLRDTPERTLSIIQIGITLVGVLAAAVGGAGASESIEPWLAEKLGVSRSTAEVLSVVGVVLPLTYVSVVLGELVPKTLALRNPMRILKVGAAFIAFIDRAFSPVVTFLESSTNGVVNTFFPRTKVPDAAPAASIEIDGLSEAHRQYVLNLADLESKRLRDVYVPWSRVVSLRTDATIEEVAAVIFSSGHTRLPVMGLSGVVGILHTKELLAYRETGDKDWNSLVRPAVKVQETFSLLSTLRLLQEKRSHLAIVYTPMSELAGIVSMEDILEEIVGDLYDEDDDGKVRKLFTARQKMRGIPVTGRGP